LHCANLKVTRVVFALRENLYDRAVQAGAMCAQFDVFDECSLRDYARLVAVRENKGTWAVIETAVTGKSLREACKGCKATSSAKLRAREIIAIVVVAAVAASMYT
jgi:hypothetical protein